MKIRIILLSILLFACQTKSKKDFIYHYKNGNVKVKFEINNDSIKDGLAEEFYPNGALQKRTWFHNGVNSDSFYIYYSNGKLKEKGLVKNGLKIGWWQYFDSLGFLTKKEEFILKSEDSIKLNQYIYYKKNRDIDSVKSSFFKIIIKKISQDSLLLKIYGNSDYKKYCLDKYDECEFINWHLIIENPCNKTKDTIVYQKDSIEVRICYRNNKIINGNIIAQFAIIDTLDTKDIVNAQIIRQDMFFTINN